MDDEQLVRLAVSGHSEVVGQLYDRYFKSIYKFFYWQTNHQPHEAEDLTQETFMEMVKSLKSFKFKSSFKNWLYAIAKNRFRHWLKRKYRQPLEPLFESIEDSSAWIDPHTQNQKINQIKTLLKTLSPQEKQVITLRYLKNYSVSDTASEIGLTPSNVKVITHRTLKKLQQPV